MIRFEAFVSQSDSIIARVMLEVKILVLRNICILSLKVLKEREKIPVLLSEVYFLEVFVTTEIFLDFL